MIEKILYAKKIVVYVLGIAAQLLTMGLVPLEVAPYIQAVLVVATGIGIFKAANEPLDVKGQHAPA